MPKVREVHEGLFSEEVARNPPGANGPQSATRAAATTLKKGAQWIIVAARVKTAALSPSPGGDAVELGGLTDHIGYALRRAQLAVFEDFITSLERVELRPGQYAVLTTVDLNPGIIQRSACDALGIATANFVPLIHKLEGRGLLRRVPVDRRSNGLFLTPKGRKLLRRADELCKAHRDRLSTALGAKDSDKLVELCQRVADATTPQER
jgi:DNA-binding MarR family transcriptional regulator